MSEAGTGETWTASPAANRRPEEGMEQLQVPRPEEREKGLEVTLGFIPGQQPLILQLVVHHKYLA